MLTPTERALFDRAAPKAFALPKDDPLRIEWDALIDATLVCIRDRLPEDDLVPVALDLCERILAE